MVDVYRLRPSSEGLDLRLEAKLLRELHELLVLPPKEEPGHSARALNRLVQAARDAIVSRRYQDAIVSRRYQELPHENSQLR